MKDRTTARGQFLTFTLGREIFALDIAKVREVLELIEVTEIPRTPDHVVGVINLRGHAVPVVNMRLKLGLGPIERSIDTCIIILEVHIEGEARAMGVLVDSVREVIGMTDADIEAAPSMGFAGGNGWVRGMGRQGDRFVIIVDVDETFADDDIVNPVCRTGDGEGYAGEGDARH
jgi:purine-binding chemotaxis protein CheW